MPHTVLSLLASDEVVIMAACDVQGSVRLPKNRVTQSDRKRDLARRQMPHKPSDGATVEFDDTATNTSSPARAKADSTK